MVTPEQRDSIVGPVRKGLTDLLTGEVGLLFDRPGFIAGGGPQDPFSNTVRAISQANCRVWAARPKTLNSDRVNGTNSILCNPFLEGIDEKPPDGSVAPPYLGGQCNAVYRAFGRVTFDRFFCGTGQNIPNDIEFNTDFVLQGPLGGISLLNDEPGQCGPRRILFTIDTATTPGAVLFTTTDVFERALFNPRIASITLERAGGQPDNCGNPVSIFRPPGVSSPIVPQPTRFPVGIPGLGDVNVNIGFNDEGDPIVCIEEVDTCIEIPVGPDGGGGGIGGPSVAPTTPGEEGEPESTGDGGEASGTAGDGQELSGVLVEVLQSPPNANKFDNVSAQILRGAGYVAMGYPGLLGIDTSAAVLDSPQFFHAQQRGLTSWRVRANVGFSLRTTPYYREVTE